MGSVGHGKKREGKVKESENWRRALVTVAPQKSFHIRAATTTLLVAVLASTVAPRSSLLEILCDHRPQVHYPHRRSKVMIM